MASRQKMDGAYFTSVQLCMGHRLTIQHVITLQCAKCDSLCTE